MPWNPSSVVQQREQFVLAALCSTQPFAELCSQLHISRKTAYKWLARFRIGGNSALADRSRKPAHHAVQWSSSWREEVLQLRHARPHWGPKKLRQCLRQSHPRKSLPACSTIARWICQANLTRRRAKRYAKQGPMVPYPGLTQPQRLHQVWTIDFKGWVRTGDGQRQEPLTIREAKSRYILDIRLLHNQSEVGVRRAMQRVFKREGLPTAIRVDNGVPFSAGGPLGLTTLSVWWLRLGIRVEFTRKARPADNAAHEHLHGRYKAEVLSTIASCRKSLQRRSDQWRHDYNHHRPHEALGQRTPASCYRPSKRLLPATLPPISSKPNSAVCLANSRGNILWQGRIRSIGRAFARQPLTLKPQRRQYHNVYLGTLLIGHLHDDYPMGMRPAQWNYLTPHHQKVSPMS